MKKPKIKIVARSLCEAAICPTVYETENGEFIIQGTVSSEEQRRQLTIAEGEAAVVVPAELLEQLRNYLNGRV